MNIVTKLRVCQLPRFLLVGPVRLGFLEQVAQLEGTVEMRESTGDELSIVKSGMYHGAGVESKEGGISEVVVIGASDVHHVQLHGRESNVRSSAYRTMFAADI